MGNCKQLGKNFIKRVYFFILVTIHKNSERQLSLMENNWDHKFKTILLIQCKSANSFPLLLEENEQIPITVFTRIHLGCNKNTASTQTVKMSPFS